LRDVARELSNAPDRPDRPQSAEEAQSRFEAYLEDLSILTPRAGLAAPTGAFIDDLIRRYRRYGRHLFICFDDPRIPSTSNELEGFFGIFKRDSRRASGTGSTTNNVVANLGADAVLAFHQFQQPGAMQQLVSSESSGPDFLAARSQLAAREQPMIRQRSMVRHLDRHLCRLKESWAARQAQADVNA
jgi:hypothetical protein